MDIVESQALLEDNAALLPQRGGRMREHRSAHRSVNITNLNPFPTDEYNPFPTDEYNEYPYDDGGDYLTVFTSDVGGQLRQSHKIPKALWVNFTQDEKNLWLGFSVDTRKRILSCSANDTSNQHNEHQASSMSSALRQRAPPRHLSRLRAYNQRPINQQNRPNQQRSVRLTDCYDNASAPGGGGDNNQDINVRFAEQFNAAGECDDVINNTVVTDEIVPTPNIELQAGTTMFSTNTTSSSMEPADDTLLIKTITSSGTPKLNPFDIRRLMEDRPSTTEVPSDDGETANYGPVSHPSIPGSAVPASSKPNSKSTKSVLRRPIFKKDKNKGIPSIMNAFVTILTCVCLLGCLPHSSASNAASPSFPPADLDCRTVEFVDEFASPTEFVDEFDSPNVVIKVKRSIRQAVSPVENSTVDAGANGCVAGQNLRAVSYTGRDANVMGIDKHQLNNLPICSCAGGCSA